MKFTLFSTVFLTIDNMQLLVVFLTVPILGAMAALTPEDMIQFGIVRQNCANQFTVNPTTIERSRAGVMVNDPQFDCMIACVLNGMDLMAPNGMLNRNAALSKVPDTGYRGALINAINSCANQRGRNRCDTAHRLYACMNAKGVIRMLRGR